MKRIPPLILLALLPAVLRATNNPADTSGKAVYSPGRQVTTGPVEIGQALGLTLHPFEVIVTELDRASRRNEDSPCKMESE